jgi:hypothetical protein
MAAQTNVSRQVWKGRLGRYELCCRRPVSASIRSNPTLCPGRGVKFYDFKNIFNNESQDYDWNKELKKRLSEKRAHVGDIVFIHHAEKRENCFDIVLENNEVSLCENG